MSNTLAWTEEGQTLLFADTLTGVIHAFPVLDVGTMDNNLHPDGSPREMTGSTGALYRVLPDGSFTREVEGVGLSNTLAWTERRPGPCCSPTRSPA